MRARGIKPSFFTDEAVVDLSPWARLLFIGLWCVADRAGRLVDKPKQLKIQLFPCDDVDVDAALAEIERGGLILRYGTGQARYIQVINFAKHQSPHVKEAESTIPAPDKHQARTRQAPGEPVRLDTSVGGTILTPDSGLLTADCGLLTPDLSEGAPKNGAHPVDNSEEQEVVEAIPRDFADIDFGEEEPEQEEQPDNRTEAQRLVAYFVDLHKPPRSKPTDRQVGILAKAIGEKLARGATPATVRLALKRIVEDGAAVSHLPAYIDKVEAGQGKVDANLSPALVPFKPPATKPSTPAETKAGLNAMAVAIGRPVT